MSSLTGPVLAEYQDLFSSTTTQGGPNGGLNLGAKAYTGDGREYRFVLAGATSLVPGKLQQTPAETTGWENLAVATAAIGATSITTTSTVTVTANAWAGGYVMVTVAPGQGYQYKIKGNPAATSAVVTLQLEDPIQIALNSSTSKIDIIANPYSAVIVNPAAASGTPIGVAVFPITNAQYGWIQVAGVANVLADGAIAVGSQVVASNATAGAVETQVAGGSSVDQAYVGTAVTGISTTEYGSIKLSIE